MECCGIHSSSQILFSLCYGAPVVLGGMDSGFSAWKSTVGGGLPFFLPFFMLLALLLVRALALLVIHHGRGQPSRLPASGVGQVPGCGGQQALPLGRS